MMIRSRVFLAMTVPVLLFAHASASLCNYRGMYIFAQDSSEQYLGWIIDNQFHAESIINAFGSYGSSFSSTSIRNQFSTYGSQFSVFSAYNSFTTTPPIIYSFNTSTQQYTAVAYLTKNQFLSPSVDPDLLIQQMQTGCTFIPSIGIAPRFKEFSASAVAGEFFAVSANFPWIALPEVDWIQIESGGTSGGSGIVYFDVAPNLGGPRQGRIEIRGSQRSEFFEVFQAGSSFLSLIPGSREHSVSAASHIISVTSNIAWEARPGNPWISIIGASSGVGDGVLTYSINENMGASREGVIIVTANSVEHEFRILQDRANAPGIHEDSTALGHNRFSSDWLGPYVRVTAAWIWHPDHNFVFVPEISTVDDFYFWDSSAMSWLWTRSRNFPLLYRFHDNAWLFYQLESSNPRVFFNLSSGEAESF